MQYKQIYSMAKLAIFIASCSAAPIPTLPSTSTPVVNAADTINAIAIEADDGECAPFKCKPKPEGCLEWDQKVGHCYQWDPELKLHARDTAKVVSSPKKLTCDDCFPFWTISIL